MGKLKLPANFDKDKIVRNLAARYKLVPHLDRALGEGEFEWHFDYEAKQGDDGWHPSGDCTPSLYDLYHKATGKGEPWVPSVGLRKTFMVGHFWHQYLQWVVEKKLGFCDAESVERRGARAWGFDADTLAEPGHHYYEAHIPQAVSAPKFRPKPFHWATGSGDLAPCDIPGHGEYVVDFKTMSSRDYRLNGMPEWCADKYECQANVYMDFFNLDKALIVCILKDSPHDMKEFEFHRNQPLIDAIYEKWKLVAACVEDGIVPPEDEEFPLPLTGTAVT